MPNCIFSIKVTITFNKVGITILSKHTCNLKCLMFVDGQNVSSTAVLVPNQRYDSDDVTSRLTKRLVYETDGPANDDVRGEIQWNPGNIIATYQGIIRYYSVHVLFS